METMLNLLGNEADELKKRASLTNQLLEDIVKKLKGQKIDFKECIPKLKLMIEKKDK